MNVGMEYSIEKTAHGFQFINKITTQSYTAYGINYIPDVTSVEDYIQNVITGDIIATRLHSYNDILMATIVFGILDDNILVFKNRLGVPKSIESFGTLGSTILRLMLD